MGHSICFWNISLSEVTKLYIAFLSVSVSGDGAQFIRLDIYSHILILIDARTVKLHLYMTLKNANWFSHT